MFGCFKVMKVMLILVTCITVVFFWRMEYGNFTVRFLGGVKGLLIMSCLLSQLFPVEREPKRPSTHQGYSNGD